MFRVNILISNGHSIAKTDENGKVRIERVCKKNNKHTDIYDMQISQTSDREGKGGFATFTTNPHDKATYNGEKLEKQQQGLTKYGLKIYSSDNADEDYKNALREQKFCDLVGGAKNDFAQAKKTYGARSPFFFVTKDISKGVRVALPIKILPGCNLFIFLEKNDNLPQAQKYGLAISLVGSMQKVHAFGIVHRDVKPENVMVTTNQDDSLTATLIDFGLSKMQDESCSANVGSFGYISLEAYDRKENNQQSDIYSLAHVLIALFFRVNVRRSQAIMEAKNKNRVKDDRFINELMNKYIQKEKNAPLRLEKLITQAVNRSLSEDEIQVIKLLQKMCNYNPKNRPDLDKILSELQDLQATYLSNNHHPPFLVAIHPPTP